MKNCTAMKQLLVPVLALALAPVALAQGPYVMITIDFPGTTGVAGNFTVGALDINSEGWVVGYHVLAGKWGSFLYRDGSFVKLPDFPNKDMTHAWKINPQGDVVGVYHNFGERQRGFLLSKGNFTSIEFPGAVETRALGINPQGHIVGCYKVSAGSTEVEHGFLLREGSFTAIDAPGATTTCTLGINSRGQIAGTYRNPTAHGFLLSDGVFTTIDFPPGATNGFVNSINPLADVGGAYQDSAGKWHGFVLRAGVYTTIDGPNASWTHVHGLNVAGEVVGMYGPGQHGFGLLLPRTR